tara:strand:+ start:528 stop:644 length:117 start_codon:yes stop_codon:yes gene_type:complete
MNYNLCGDISISSVVSNVLRSEITIISRLKKIFNIETE